MAFSAKILADSVAPNGRRLTSIEIVFPRIILAELNTHRQLSKNSASSRAIPIETMLRRVREEPYIPSTWGKNQKGMSASIDLDERDASKARDIWLHARDAAVAQAEKLLDAGVHKQLTNRLLEPFLWHTVLVTATEWSNFFHLRNNKDAHPDMQTIAKMMQEQYKASEPTPIREGEWHLPFRSDFDATHLTESGSVKANIGRCARVSYLTHDGARDLQADISLHDRLLVAGHMSPFEHVARPATEEDVWQYGRLGGVDLLAGDAPKARNAWFGNFQGWVQFRKMIPCESDILALNPQLTTE